MVNRPVGVNAFEFVILATLRAQQLLRGCVPRLEGDHGVATMAQMEVAGGLVGRAPLVASATDVEGAVDAASGAE